MCVTHVLLFVGDVLFLGDKGFNVVDDQFVMQKGHAVDIADAALWVDQKHPQDMRKGVAVSTIDGDFALHILFVGIEDGCQGPV